ncbi:MAG: acyl-CoA thioesterase [Rickettsiales bacterium]|jgi:acyl-CoA thioester hydrolase|nr:acyl-CoA thioesterase [Rickettsiales bacterium]
MDNMQGFKYSRQVYYYDTDAAGVVYHGNYFHFCEDARTAIFLKLAKMSLKEYADKTGVGFVISRAQVEYICPVALNARVDVVTYIESITGVRIKYRHEIWVGGLMCAVVRLETVSVSTSTFRPAKMSAGLFESYKKAFAL